ncbi:DUF371 domain-containing protein [Acidianus sp. HS-5]|uniref:DUF371 domain-containing protein n=1 Tax=Acidianus sp. HS-5 TaxID=2886040 RepID=UPI001F471AF2|nr:DUF371 domain-containing protein [Acidianus sp. HS-5]BDC18328.1 hypothetical protein HS5_12180 [Acidianus sp. HS-5]
MIAIDSLEIYGHPNVLGKHRSTLEFTKEDYLTLRGDCILGINSTKAIVDLKEEVKEILRENGYGYVVIKIDDTVDIISGRGNTQMTFSNKIKMIIRKSNFISDSTLLIYSDKAAVDIKREIVNKLRQGSKAKVFIIASDVPLKNEEILRIIINS